MSNLTDRKSAKSIVPVDIRLLTYGFGFGLFFGLLAYFGPSSCECAGDLDLAASRGVALFITITVGIFLGTKLGFLVLAGFGKWIARLVDRLDVCEARIARLNGEGVSDASPDEDVNVSGFLKIRFKAYYFALGCGFCGLVTSIMQMVIWAGTTGIYDSSGQLSALVSVAIVLFGASGLAVELGGTARNIAKIERVLDDAEEVSVVTSVPVRPDYADAALQAIQSFIYKLTGMRGWQPSVAVA